MSIKKNVATHRAGRFFDTGIYGRNFGPMLEPDGLGGGAPPEGGGDDSPSFNADTFREEMQDFTVRAINGAISTHMSRGLDKKFEENNGQLLSQFKEMMSSQQSQANPAPQSGNTDVDTAIKNATAPLMKQLEEQRALNDRNAAMAASAEKDRKYQEESSELHQALTAAGVVGPLASAAVHNLHGSLERDSSGAIVYIAKETGPTGPYSERVSVAEGVKRYLSTDDGKHFLPARSVGGAGNRGGAAPSANPEQQNDASFVGDMLGALLG